VSAIDNGHDMERLRERRRQARLRRRLARLDAGLAVTGALVVLLATPGLAVAAVIALVLLAVCGASLLWERAAARRSDRARRRSPAREPIRYP
jgi:Flp pilus assembly protein TadB